VAHSVIPMFDLISVETVNTLTNGGYRNGTQLAGVLEWCSGKIERLTPLRSWVQFLIGPVPHVIKRATHFDSIDLLWVLRFPPTLHFKLPNIVNGQKSKLMLGLCSLIQYLK
jgi:hypothetical protein